MPKLLALAIFAALLSFPASGDAQSGPPDGGWPHHPHPEALAACKDKNEGDACEFDAPNGKISGACRKARSGDLVCMGPHHHHHDGGAP